MNSKSPPLRGHGTQSGDDSRLDGHDPRILPPVHFAQPAEVASGDIPRLEYGQPGLLAGAGHRSPLALPASNSGIFRRQMPQGVSATRYSRPPGASQSALSRTEETTSSPVIKCSTREHRMALNRFAGKSMWGRAPATSSRLASRLAGTLVRRISRSLLAGGSPGQWGVAVTRTAHHAAPQGALATLYSHASTLWPRSNDVG